MSDEVKKYNVDMYGDEYEYDEGKYVKCEDHERIVKELQDEISERANKMLDQTIQIQLKRAENADLTAKLKASGEWNGKLNSKLQRLESVIEEIREIGETNQSWKLVFESLDRGKELKG